MARYPFTPTIIAALDTLGVSLSGAKAFAYAAGTTTPVTIYAAATGGTTLTNPVIANSAGRFAEIWLDVDVSYRIKVTNAAGSDTLYDVDPIAPPVPSNVALYSTLAGLGGAALIGTSDGDTVQDHLDNPVFVATRTDMAAIVNPSHNDGIFLQEAGREGVFVFNLSDLSAQVTLDTLQGLYVAPASDTDGSSGAWVRRFSGGRNVRWWGAKGDGVTDDLPAFEACIASFSPSTALTASWKGGQIIVPIGDYYLSDTWQITKHCTVSGEHQGEQLPSAASRLIWPTDSTGILISRDDGGAFGDASGARTIIERLSLCCASKGTVGYGIHATATPYIRDCIIREFGSDAIYIQASTGAGTNADCWKVDNVETVNNGGDGLHLDGNDTNAGVATNFQARANGGWGIDDESQFGNTYIGHTLTGNTLGAIYDKAGGSVYMGYIEGGSGSNCELVGVTMFLGGTQDVPPGGMGLNQEASGLGIIVPTAGRMINFKRENAGSTANEVFARIVSDTEIFEGMLGYDADNEAGESVVIRYSRVTSTTNTNSAHNHIVFANPTGANVGSIVTTAGATAYNTSSDHRLKEEVEPITSALDRILQLKPVSFKWKGEGAAGRGFIAHELQEVIPLAVTGAKDATVDIGDLIDSEGGIVASDIEQPEAIADGFTWAKTGEKPTYQGVDNSKIIPDLVAAMIELSAIVMAGQVP